MTISFVGGPYDGQQWSVAEARRLIIFTASRRPRRRFVYLPVLPGGPPVRSCYEVIDTDEGRQFHHFPGGDDPDH